MIALAAALLVTFIQPNTVTRERDLGPGQGAVLACRPSEEPVGSDAAVLRPFDTTRRVWLDGGEVEGWRHGGRLVATARVSQTLGLRQLAFRSYGRAVAVEIICRSR